MLKAQVMLKSSLVWLACLGLLGCQTPAPLQSSSGSLSITVQFPRPDFATQLIRPETRVIYVAVYNRDMSYAAPLVFGPITASNPMVRLNQLAAGEQIVIAAAYDQQKQILTAGRIRAFVRSSSLSQISLDLQEDYSQRLQDSEHSFLKNLKIELPPENQPQPTRLTPVDLNPISDPNDQEPLPAPVTESALPSAAPSPKPSALPGQDVKQTGLPTPTPSPSVYYSSGGSGGEAASTPVSTPTPISAPTQEPSSVNPDVTVQDGSNTLDPVSVDSPDQGGPAA